MTLHREIEQARRDLYLEKFLDVLRVNKHDYPWDQHGGAASGVARMTLDGKFIEVSWSYPHVTLSLIEENNQTIISWGVDKRDKEHDKAIALINSIPCRREELDALFENIMASLTALSKKHEDVTTPRRPTAIGNMMQPYAFWPFSQKSRDSQVQP